MKKHGSLQFIFIAAIASTIQAAHPVAGIDPAFFNASGWTWGAFGEGDAVQASDQGFEVHVTPSDATNWPGTVNGGIGINLGELELDFELYQLEIPIRVLDDNEASNFRVTIGEVGTPDTGEEYNYHFDLTDLDDELVTLTRPLMEWTSIWTNGGDGEPTTGIGQLQLQTIWNSVDPLNIDVEGVYVRPIDPIPDEVVFELNGNNFTRGYTFGSFNDEGAVASDHESIIIAAEPGGGLGTSWLETEFDEETHEIIVHARLGEDNEAETFVVNLKDNDGLEAIDEIASEEWIFEFFTADFHDVEFTEVRLPLTDPGPIARWSGFGAIEDGDQEMNFGMYQIQVHNLDNAVGLLHLEMKSIKIVESGNDDLIGDFDGDGSLGANDIDILMVAVQEALADSRFDLNRDGLVNEFDFTKWIVDLKNTFIGDANLDGEFNSSDFVSVFRSGKYETGQEAGWAEGDWNYDSMFTSSDFVAAFRDGGYEQGPRPATLVVPEVSSWVLSLVCLMFCWRLRSSQQSH